MENIPQWVTVGLGVVGFFVTWTGIAIGWGKAVGTITSEIKEYTSDKISSETKKIQDDLRGLTEHFEDSQRTQDSNVSEVIFSIRQYVANVEKEMHQIEIWGRDNYVQKPEFSAALNRIEEGMRIMAREVRADIRALMKNRPAAEEDE